MLLERKRKILATYETKRVQAEAAASAIAKQGERMQPPKPLREAFERAFATSSCATWSSSGTRPATSGRDFGRQLAAAGRAAGRQVPGRRAGRPSTTSPAARR